MRQIAELAGGVTESFVSHVSSEKRQHSFACEQLELIEQNCDESIEYMLLSSRPIESVPEDKRDSYKKCLELLRELDAVRETHPENQ